MSIFNCYNLSDMSKIAKKEIILYVFKILYKGSSEDNPITQTQIANVLNSIGVKCDRRTVGRNIQYLINFGLPIFKKLGGGYFYYKEKDTFLN